MDDIRLHKKLVKSELKIRLGHDKQQLGVALSLSVEERKSKLRELMESEHATSNARQTVDRHDKVNESADGLLTEEFLPCALALHLEMRAK